MRLRETVAQPLLPRGHPLQMTLHVWARVLSRGPLAEGRLLPRSQPEPDEHHAGLALVLVLVLGVQPGHELAVAEPALLGEPPVPVAELALAVVVVLAAFAVLAVFAAFAVLLVVLAVELAVAQWIPSAPGLLQEERRMASLMLLTLRAWPRADRTSGRERGAQRSSFET